MTRDAGGGPDGRVAGGDGREDVDLLVLASILLRQWLLIAIIAGLFVGAGAAYVITAPKTWKATARVLLDPRDKQVIGPGVAVPVQGTDPTWVDTQASVVMSEPTLRRAVETLDLAKDPEFGGTPEETLRKLSETVVVERADQTYVLDVSATTRSPEKSARIAQAVADAFVASIVDFKASSIREATDLIGGQIDELREKARKADLALQEYKRDNGLVSASGRMVDQEQLRQLNEAAVTARTRAQEAAARYDTLRAAMKAGGTGYGAALDSVNSAVISRLRIEYALASKTVAELGEQLGPSHPRMEAARADVERTRSLIAEELRSLAAAAKADRDVAAASEAAARQALAEATEIVNRNGVAGVRLRELENEATIRSEMYRGFVARMQQTALQTDVQVSDARVIVPAQPPLYPASPRRSLILALSGIAGLGLGLTAALFRGRAALVGGGTTAAPAPKVLIGRHGEGARPEPPRRRGWRDLFFRQAPPEADAAPAIPERAVPVLASVTVDTADRAAGRAGRSLARSPAEIVSSMVESAAGRVHGPGVEAMRAVAGALAPADGERGISLVIGTTSERATAAASFGLARGFADRGGRVLLVDASCDDFRLADAFLADGSGGILDVIDGGADAADIVAMLDGGAITVLPAADFEDSRRLGREAGRIAGFVRRLSEDYHQTVVHLGSDPNLSLLQALSPAADAVVLAADRGTETTADGIRLARDLSDLTPAFAGLVLVEERGAARAAAAAA